MTAISGYAGCRCQSVETRYDHPSHLEVTNMMSLTNDDDDDDDNDDDNNDDDDDDDDSDDDNKS